MSAKNLRNPASFISVSIGDISTLLNSHLHRITPSSLILSLVLAQLLYKGPNAVSVD